MSKTYSAGIVTAYGAAKRAGYQGTYEDFCRQQAGYAGNAAAVEAAKTAAQTAANTATAKAGEAATAATAAQTAKTQTEAAASQALTDISTASSGAISAVQTEGATQTANATAQAQAAAQSATTASTKASEASASATSAGQSATNAAASATSAATSASAAQVVLESIPEDYSDLSEDVDKLKADLDNNVTDLKSALYESREFYNVTGDARTGTGAFSFDISETLVTTKKYIITVKCDTALDSNCTIYLRTSGGGSNTSIGTFASGETTHTFTNVVPTADATMVRFAKGMVGAKYTVIVSEVVALTEKALDKIDVLDDAVKAKTITEKTPITKFGTFERGTWQNATTFKTSVQYRVSCRTDITFNKDVSIACIGAFFLQGYIDGVYFEKVSTINVPKNKPLKLIIRRIWEDPSETANIDEFASTVFVLDYSEASEYNLLSDTFAGIEMFRTAGFIGDSYTAKRLGHSWVDIIGNRTGVQTTRFAKSGDNAGAWITDNANGLPALLNDTVKDLYWIALGINDANRYDNDASYIGSIADISGNYEDYPDTFYGNMGHIVEAIQEHAPSAKIVLYKPIYRAVWRTLGGISATTSTHMVEIRDAIGEIAEHYSLPFMDALDDVLFISDWYSKHMDYDIDSGNHPSLLLYPAIASANMRLFSKCVQDNANYFMGLYYTD